MKFSFIKKAVNCSLLLFSLSLMYCPFSFGRSDYSSQQIELYNTHFNEDELSFIEEPNMFSLYDETDLAIMPTEPTKFQQFLRKTAGWVLLKTIPVIIFMQNGYDVAKSRSKKVVDRFFYVMRRILGMDVSSYAYSNENKA